LGHCDRRAFSVGSGNGWTRSFADDCAVLGARGGLSTVAVAMDSGEYASACGFLSSMCLPALGLTAVAAADCLGLAASGCILQMRSTPNRSLQPADETTPGRHLGGVHRRLEPKNQAMPSHGELTRAALHGLGRPRRQRVCRHKPILAHICKVAPRMRAR